MKLSSPYVRIVTGLGLAAGLFLGCQNILDQSADSSSGSTITDPTALRLSIKDDSTCKEEWSAILAGRTSGKVDTVAEAGFLANCVKEVKPTDKNVTVIPPNLVPDSNTRCHWIVAQIEGGRDSMTVSYNRYCPDDCHKLALSDSAKHDQLCREPGDGPGKGPGKDTTGGPGKGPGKDTTGHADDDTCKMLTDKLNTVKPGEPGRADVEHLFAMRCKDEPGKPPKDTLNPPAHNPYEDTCRMIKEKLDSTKPGAAGRADLEHLYAGLCKEWIPIDSLPKPPKDTIPHPIEDDTCKMLTEKLMVLKPGEAGRADLEHLFAARCKEPMPKPPVDTLVKPPMPKPPIDTLPKPPKDTGKGPEAPHDSVCADLKLQLGASAPGSAGHSDLEAAFKAKCMAPIPPVVKPPVVNCDELRATLAKLDTASADYAKVKASLSEHCPVKPVTP